MFQHNGPTTRLIEDHKGDPAFDTATDYGFVVVHTEQATFEEFDANAPNAYSVLYSHRLGIYFNNILVYYENIGYNEKAPRETMLKAAYDGACKTAHIGHKVDPVSCKIRLAAKNLPGPKKGRKYTATGNRYNSDPLIWPNGALPEEDDSPYIIPTFIGPNRNRQEILREGKGSQHNLTALYDIAYEYQGLSVDPGELVKIWLGITAGPTTSVPKLHTPVDPLSHEEEIEGEHVFDAPIGEPLGPPNE